jgi:RNA-directed DNA polymerase
MVKVQDAEGIASHSGPESCAVAGDRVSEAWTGVRAGRVWSREIRLIWGDDLVGRWGKRRRCARYRECTVDPARSETPCMHARTSCGNREIPRLPLAVGAWGRIGKSKDVRR